MVDEQGEMIVKRFPTEPKDGLDCGSYTGECTGLDTQANQSVEDS
jgi:hypothetical protein